MKIQMHKGIVMKVGEHNPTTAEKQDIFHLDRHFQMTDHTYQQIYDQKLTNHVQSKLGNPAKN